MNDDKWKQIDRQSKNVGSHFWSCRVDALVSRLVEPWKSLALLVPVSDCSWWG
jgi:hypothetical protein